MSEEVEVVLGSGNVFADLGREDAEVLQLKALLAADIIKTLDERALTVRRAEELTGIAAADFSRIRQAKLERFTVDRLMAIVRRLGRKAEVSVTFRPQAPQVHPLS